MGELKNILFQDLAQIIEQGKKQVVAKVNSTITLVYWQVGNRINTELLHNERAEYAKEVVSIVAEQLAMKYGNSFAEKNLRRMIQFAKEFSDFEIVVPLARQLSWSHFTILIPLKNEEKRLFYAIKSAEETWSRNELRRQIERKAFERKEIAKIQLSETPSEIQNSFKDPYFLDFLGLKDGYLENNLEAAILKELHKLK